MRQIDSDELKARLYISYAKNIERWTREREKHTDALLKQGVFKEAVECEKKQTASRVMACALALIDDAETVGALAELEQQWIPCSKRTPTAKYKTYWVCTDTGYQCECRWTNVNHFWTDLTTEWHWHIMDIPQYSKVVAWRELPEPYEGENDESD